MFIFLAILLRSDENAKLPLGTQGCYKTCNSVRTANAKARTHVFRPQIPQYCRTITVQWPCALFHGCRKNPTNRTSTHEVRPTVARPHLWQSCNCASISGDSPARERNTSVRASYGCLTFSKKKLHEECHFVCDLPHGLTPATNRTTNRSHDWCETDLTANESITTCLFKIFIWGGKHTVSKDIGSEIELFLIEFRQYIRRYTSQNKNLDYDHPLSYAFLSLLAVKTTTTLVSFKIRALQVTCHVTLVRALRDKK